MKLSLLPPRLIATVASLAAALVIAGCASTGGESSTGSGAQPSSKFKLADGRTVDIGKSSPAEGGANYKNPHLEKCWLADGFDFNGYDTLYIAPVLSTAKFHQENPEEVKVRDLAKENLVAELTRKINAKKIFNNVVTRESDLKPDVKSLKLESTITEFTKGGGAARYFVGLYGGGQPVLRVQGKMTGADKPLFTFEARRSGVSAGARMSGVFMKDEDIQMEDIRSMVLDLTDFMAIVAKKEPLRQ
jgi:hypothetical protein